VMQKPNARANRSGIELSSVSADKKGALTVDCSCDGKGVGTLGLNDKKRAEYDPVCSKGPGSKTYHLTIYAFSDTIQNKASDLNRAKLLKEFKVRGLGAHTLDVTYERK